MTETAKSDKRTISQIRQTIRQKCRENSNRVSQETNTMNWHSCAKDTWKAKQNHWQA